MPGTYGTTVDVIELLPELFPTRLSLPDAGSAVILLVNFHPLFLASTVEDRTINMTKPSY